MNRSSLPSKLRSKITYANVVSTICLFLLTAGGGAYAAGALRPASVGTRQLKNGAVTGAKVKDRTLTGSDLDLATLGTVPSAAIADQARSSTSAATAQSAAHADSAAHAESATHADSAAHADSATVAGNAELLAGAPPSAYKASCPAGTAPAPGDLCLTTASLGKSDWATSLEACAARGLMVPTPAQAYAIDPALPAATRIWTQSFYKEGGTPKALSFQSTPSGLFETPPNVFLDVFCVTTPAEP